MRGFKNLMLGALLIGAAAEQSLQVSHELTMRPRYSPRLSTPSPSMVRRGAGWPGMNQRQRRKMWRQNPHLRKRAS